MEQTDEIKTEASEQAKQEQKREEKQEEQKSAARSTISGFKMGMSAFAAILQNDSTALMEASEETIRAAAEWIGNSNLNELLNGGDSGPELLKGSIDRTMEEEPEEVNKITTKEPELLTGPAIFKDDNGQLYDKPDVCRPDLAEMGGI